MFSVGGKANRISIILLLLWARPARAFLDCYQITDQNTYIACAYSNDGTYSFPKTTRSFLNATASLVQSVYLDRRTLGADNEGAKTLLKHVDQIPPGTTAVTFFPRLSDGSPDFSRPALTLKAFLHDPNKPRDGVNYLNYVRNSAHIPEGQNEVSIPVPGGHKQNLIVSREGLEQLRTLDLSSPVEFGNLARAPWVTDQHLLDTAMNMLDLTVLHQTHPTIAVLETQYRRPIVDNDGQVAKNVEGEVLKTKSGLPIRYERGFGFSPLGPKITNYPTPDQDSIVMFTGYQKLRQLVTERSSNIIPLMIGSSSGRSAVLNRWEAKFTGDCFVKSFEELAR